MRIIKIKKKLVEKNMKTKTNKKNIFKKLVENMQGSQEYKNININLKENMWGQ